MIAALTPISTDAPIDAMTAASTSPQAWAAMTIAALGMFFTLVSTIGIVRMPDVYTRMQAAAKAGTLGVALTIMAVPVYFGGLTTTMLGAVIVLFVFLTAPIASHLIGRAAYFLDVPRWEGMKRDDVAGCYDWETHDLYPTRDQRDAAAEDRAEVRQPVLID